MLRVGYQLLPVRGVVMVCVMGVGVWSVRGAYRPNIVQVGSAVVRQCCRSSVYSPTTVALLSHTHARTPQRAIDLDAEAVAATVSHFQAAGFPYVCTMRDGFAGAFRAMQVVLLWTLCNKRRAHTEHVQRIGVDPTSTLVDYDAERCACARHQRLVEFLRHQSPGGKQKKQKKRGAVKLQKPPSRSRAASGGGGDKGKKSGGGFSVRTSSCRSWPPIRC